MESAAEALPGNIPVEVTGVIRDEMVAMQLLNATHMA